MNQKELQHLAREGFVRVKVDGELRDLSEEIRLDKKKKHSIEVVVDRLVVKHGIEKRLADSMETAARMGQGTVLVEEEGGPDSPVQREFRVPRAWGVSRGDISQAFLV